MEKNLKEKPEHNYRVLELDPWLSGYEKDISLRMDRFESEKKRFLGSYKSLSDYANGHMFYGFNKTDGGWYYREWAPNAVELHLIGDFNNWNRESHKLKKLDGGIFEIFIEGEDTLAHESKVKVQITTPNGKIDRIPLYCKRVIQNPVTHAYDGQIWNPKNPFNWTDDDWIESRRIAINNSEEKITEPFIYECHIGMSGEEDNIASYDYFTDNVLPRIKKLGYNTIQLMAIMEHAYYASFGYQVTNFYAVTSRYGEPEGLKRLINTAHSMGIAVLLDIVHSHASSNALDGIGEFDGTDYQFFHRGELGEHPAWGSKLFNYGRAEVVHFLLSNIKFWLTEYHFDGFRFDGVTSMLYHDRGLGSSFDNYSKYFSMNTDVEAVTYLQLATSLAKEVRPDVLLIAEDMSGMPGMCLSIKDGGIGFDYRLAMGMPDFWIKTLRETKDEDWDLGWLWHELIQRRPEEKAIGYCESHDQALVGDKTIMFWLADKEMYWSMSKHTQSHVIDRAISLHKIIRLVTCICSGEGYLNFMGNEFGHPEWIDFPREGNGWSYHYARRQWHLADDPELRYEGLYSFDRDMIHLAKTNNLLSIAPNLIYHDNINKILIFTKGDFLFIFNFHPQRSYSSKIDSYLGCSYKVVMNSDWERYSGFYAEADSCIYTSKKENDKYLIEIPVNNRSALVCKLI